MRIEIRRYAAKKAAHARTQGLVYSAFGEHFMAQIHYAITEFWIAINRALGGRAA